MYQDEKSKKGNLKPLSKVGHASLKDIDIQKRKNFTREFHRVDFDFIGVNENVEIGNEEASKSYTNYYNVPQAVEGILKVNHTKRLFTASYTII